MPCIHAYTYTCTLTLFAYERGFPIDQDVYACMLMFGKCIPFILETLFRYEEKGKRREREREREPFRGRNSMQIRERDRSEAFDESFVGYSNGVVACAGRVHARREGVKWVEGVGRLSDESFRSRLFSFSIHGPLPFY